MRPTFLPSPRQELLLAVALGTDADEARTAWQKLRLDLDLDNLEPGSFALLPLAYRTLARLDVKDSRLERLKGIYRSTWTKNNLLVARARETVATFDTAPILLGGLTVAGRYYGELGLRPTPSLDLLVEPVARAAATAALERAGWVRTGRGHADWFSDRQGWISTLRTAIVPGLEHDEELRRAVTPLELVDGALALSPTDELLAACLTGGRPGPAPSIAWIADSERIADAAAIDWSRLVGTALASRQTLRLRPRIEYLASRLEVPLEARRRLADAPVSRRERTAHSLMNGDFSRLGGLPTALGEHLASEAGLHELPASLRTRWGLDHDWQLPLAAGRRAWRVVRGRSA
jgi:hypothetical protein